MNRQTLELTKQILFIAYPNLDKNKRRKLLRLVEKKRINLVNVIHYKLDDLLCSIFRHEDTDYDRMLDFGIKKEVGREIVQQDINKKLKYAKGLQC